MPTRRASKSVPIRKKAPAPPKPRPVASAKAPVRRACAARDPFGDPCQSSPRLPSKYCTIHSYLDRQ